MDKKFLLIAINLAKKNLGAVSPNPSVGCVIVKDGRILAAAATQKGGRPHAERLALEKMPQNVDLSGCVMYVSLEPCCHFGETPPCCDAIIASGIKRVVVAAVDNDARVNGGGILALEKAGIEVDLVEMEEAYALNKAFFKAKATGLPYVTLKLATSLDGKIACGNFASKWISSEEARRFAHQLRALNDAILVGGRTFAKDQPRLDCRIAGLEDKSPTKFVLGRKITGCEGVNFIENDDLEAVLREICEKGHNSLLVEGGAGLATALLRLGLVDEIMWIKAAKIIGDDGIGAVGGLGFEGMDEVWQGFERVGVREFVGGDVALVYRV